MAAIPKPVSQFLDLRLDDLRTAPEGIAQRPFRRSRGEHLARTFNPAKFGIPVVNCVEGVFWVIDGQHRLYAYRRQPGVTGDTRVRCEVYDHLSQAEMADLFLGRNDTLNVTSFDRFYVACAAGYKRECAVRAVLDKLDLRVSRSPGSGSISAVGAMLRVNDRAGVEFLERALLVLRDAYAGDPEAFSRGALEGVALVLVRHAEVDDVLLVEALVKYPNGFHGLFRRADTYRERLGRPLPHCVAAAVVDVYNKNQKKSSRKHRLPGWWKA